jgi:hypothetical protein
MELQLTATEIHEAHKLATARYEFAAKNYSAEDSGSGEAATANRFINHLAGAFGEAAFEKFLTQNGVNFDPAYKDLNRDREADFVVGGTGVDVKTHFSAANTARFPQKQERGLGKKTKVVVWMSEYHNPHSWDEDVPGACPTVCTVWLFAWAKADAILSGERVELYLIPKITEPPETLLAELRGRASAPDVPAGA